MIKWRLTPGQIAAIVLGIWIGALVGARSPYDVIMLWVSVTYMFVMLAVADHYGQDVPWRSVFSPFRRAKAPGPTVEARIAPPKARPALANVTITALAAIRTIVAVAKWFGVSERGATAKIRGMARVLAVVAVAAAVLIASA